MNAQQPTRTKPKRLRRPIRTPYVVSYVLIVAGTFAAWIAVSILAAARQEDLDDPTPVLRTIAFGAAVFVLLTLGVAGQLAVRWQRRTNAVLYRKLIRSALDADADDDADADADADADDGDVDGAIEAGLGADGGDGEELPLPYIDPVLDRRSPVMPVGTHLRFASIVSFLALVGVSSLPDGPIVVIGIAIAMSLLAWLIWAVRSGRRITTSDEYLAPLGLANSERHGVIHRGGVDADDIEISGHRSGWSVTVLQHRQGSITTINAVTQERAVTTPSHMQLLTGEPQRTWRDVLVESDGLRVRVHRTHPRAARWMLHDLLLAEAVVDVAWGHGPDI